jgi:hypothetical protein
MNYIKQPVQIITQKILMPNLEIDFPIVMSGESVTAVQNMNMQIFDLVKKLIADQGYFEEPFRTQMNGSFEIKSNLRGVLSLSIINYAYHYHAAHGMTIIKSLTFDTASGKNYELHEQFKPDSDYLRVLTQNVAKQAEQRDIFLLNGIKPVTPDQDYYIADKALVIYYQLYELTSYAYGFPYFPISVYDLESLIKEDSPLSLMLING